MPSRVAEEADDQARNEEAGLSAGAAVRELGTTCAACFAAMSLAANDAPADHCKIDRVAELVQIM